MSLGSLSLAYACRNCGHHVVFAPKYRRKAFFRLRRPETGRSSAGSASGGGIEIHDAVICLDRVRMPISISPKFSVSGVLGCLKGKSSLMIRQKRGNANSECRNREFWCRWHCIDVVGKNALKIAEYIRNQLKGG